MSREKLITADRGVSDLTGHANLYGQPLQTEPRELQMKIYLDYCYFIEKLWLDWKEYCLRFFTFGD